MLAVSSIITADSVIYDSFCVFALSDVLGCTGRQTAVIRMYEVVS